MASNSTSSIDFLKQPLTLPCGLVLPNRLVKCPMQETLAKAPLFDPPIDHFAKLYKQWAEADYGLIITGQVQIDLRFLSVQGDVVTHRDSLEEPHFGKWKRWAKIAKAGGTPCIVQLAHPGRMSRAGAGVRPQDMQTLCPSSVPLKAGNTWLDKLAVSKILGIPKAMTLEEIDSVVEMWKHATRVAQAAGFDGIQLHAAHGFLLSQFLSPHTNRRTDEYGGTPEKRMKLLKRLVIELRKMCPPPFCLSVKLNSADYMETGGLTPEEGFEQVRWLATCGMVDFIEISGGNSEQKTDGLRNSFNKRTLSKAPERKESTRIREAFYSAFCERVKIEIDSNVPIQLSGGFRSRNGMADAIEKGTCDLIGLGRAAVLEPSLPREKLLNPAIPDSEAFAISHVTKGQWLARWFPVRIIGAGFNLQFFYHTMRRLGNGLKPDPNISLPKMVVLDVLELFQSGFMTTVNRMLAAMLGEWGAAAQKID